MRAVGMWPGRLWPLLGILVLVISSLLWPPTAPAPLNSGYICTLTSTRCSLQWVRCAAAADPQPVWAPLAVNRSTGDAHGRCCVQWEVVAGFEISWSREWDLVTDVLPIWRLDAVGFLIYLPTVRMRSSVLCGWRSATSKCRAGLALI